MNARTSTRDEAVADFHALYVLDERHGRLRAVDEYQRRFPGFEEVVRTQYALLSGEIDATQVDFLQSADWAPSDLELDRSRDLGPYRLKRLLGRGAQGTVYEAEHRYLRRTVALKVLANKWLFSKSHQARFEREAAAAARLEHPGICSVYDFQHGADIDYIVMRYVEGEALSNALRAADERWASNAEIPARSSGPPGSSPSSLPLRPTSRPDLEILLKFFEQCAEALQVAHDARVVHRDIKPGNIMVTPALEPVLLDFGLARDEQFESDGGTRTGDLIGTRGYIAPEQIRGDRTVDARVDVYALGVVLYECLTLTRPHAQPTWESLLHAVTHEPAPDVRMLNPAVPRDVAVIVETALEKDPVRRYRSARAFAEDLQRARTGLEILATRPGWSRRCARWVQRKARALVTVAACALVLALIGSLTWGVRLQVKARERATRDEQHARFELAMRRVLEHPHRLSSRIDVEGRRHEPTDFYATVQAADAALSLGGLDLQALGTDRTAPAARMYAMALEPEFAMRTAWMLFQLVEDIDELRAFHDAASKSRTQGHLVDLDAQTIARIRDGATQVLDERLGASTGLVWRAYQESSPADSDSFRSMRESVLSADDPLAHLMLSHLAWTKDDKAVAFQALSDDVIWSIHDPSMKMICWMEQGSIQLLGGNALAAEQAFKLGQACATAPSFIGYFSLAKAAAAQGDFDLAMERLRRALTLEPNDRVALTSLANLLAYENDFAGAQVSAEAAINADPDYAFGYLELGRALIGLDRLREALGALNEALELSSAGDAMTDQVDAVLASVEDPSAIDREVADLLTSIGMRPWWISVRASAQLHLKDADAALALAESGLALAPRDESLMARRAQAYLEAREPEIALASFELLLAQAPGNAAGLFGRARCLDWLKQPRQAVEAYVDACEVDPVYIPEVVDFVRLNGDQQSMDRLVLIMKRSNAAVPASLLVRTESRDEAVRRVATILHDARVARRTSSSTLNAESATGTAYAALESVLEREDAPALFHELQPDIQSISDPALRIFAEAQAALAAGNYAAATDCLTEWLQVPVGDIDTIRRALETLLRLGESEKAAWVIDGLQLDPTSRLQTLGIRAFLADGRFDDVSNAGGGESRNFHQLVAFATCALMQGQPARAIDTLDKLPCYRRNYADARALRARACAMNGDQRGARAAVGDDTSEPQLALESRAIKYATSMGGEPELVAAVRDYVDGRIREGSRRVVAWCSVPKDSERALRLAKVCDAGLALILARGLAPWATGARPNDSKAAVERGRALLCLLGLLESHLAGCARDMNGAVDAVSRELRVMELQSVLTAPEFAVLRRSHVDPQFEQRLAAYFDGVRRTLGSKLWQRR